MSEGIRLGPVRIADRRSPWQSQAVYLELDSAGIRAISPTPEPAKVWVSSGWVEVCAWSSQPQLPAQESLAALARRAWRGGFTTLLIGGWQGWHEPEIIAQLRRDAASLPVEVLFLAAWATPEGDIAPLESLRAEGAFGWALPPEWSLPWRTLIQALPYLRYLGGPIFVLPFWEAHLVDKGVPEAPELALSGWEGLPDYTETVAVHALAALRAAYGGTILVGPLTTAAGLQEARRHGLLSFTGLSYTAAEASQLLTYDAFWKLHPPLRPQSDRLAILQALSQGQIPLIASYDYLAPPEEKETEWASAAVGQPTLEVLAPLLWQALQEATPEPPSPTLLAEVLSERPRRILGLPYLPLDIGHPLDLTVFAIEDTPRPTAWPGWTSPLRVVGPIRSVADAHNLRSQMP